MRFATPEESDAIHTQLNALSDGNADAILGDCMLGLDDGAPQRVCMVSPMIAALPTALLADAEAGLPIGTWEDGAFHLDLQGAVLVAEHTIRNTVRVKETVARLFLYGRGVLAGSVLGRDKGLRPGDVCIVTDPRREALGMGQVVGSFKGNREVVRPIHDLGRYLRDQGGG